MSIQTISVVIARLSQKGNGVASHNGIEFSISHEKFGRLEKGAVVTCNVSSSWSTEADSEVLKVHSVEKIVWPAISAAYARVQSFNMKKARGVVRLLDGDFAGRTARIDRDVAEKVSLWERGLATGMPLSVRVRTMGDSLAIDSAEFSSEIAKAVKSIKVGAAEVATPEGAATEDDEDDEDDQAAQAA